MVTGFVDQASGLREVPAGEVVVGEVKPHTGPGGDAEYLVEIMIRAASEEPARQVVERPRAAEEVDGLVEVVGGFGGAALECAAERKVVQADVEEPSLLFHPEIGRASCRER